MRKVLMIFAIASLLIWVPYGNASVQVQLFDQTFVRSKGLPDPVKSTFPSTNGQALIEVYNGDNDPTTRESSAVITLNKKIIFYQSMFSNKIKYLKTTLKLTQGQNTLSVLLTGKPKSTIKIRISQQVEADSANVIGPSGGTIISNAGVKLNIPSGALTEPIVLTVKQTTLENDLPDEVGIAGPVFEFGPDGTQFKQNITITLPYIDNDNDGIVYGTDLSVNSLTALTYNGEMGRWLYLEKLSTDKTNKTVTFAVEHFTRITMAGLKLNKFGTELFSIFTIDGCDLRDIISLDPSYINRPSYLRPAILYGYGMKLMLNTDFRSGYNRHLNIRF